MTTQALEEGQKILHEITKVDDAFDALRPYLHHPVKLTINIEREDSTSPSVREIWIHSDSPLFLAIGSALIDMKKELKQKLKDLDSNSEVSHREMPIRRTTFWDKVWGKH